MADDDIRLALRDIITVLKDMLVKLEEIRKAQPEKYGRTDNGYVECQTFDFDRWKGER